MDRLEFTRGDIIWVDFGPERMGITAGPHPAVVVQNDTGNKFSTITIVVPLTDQRQFKDIPVQVLLTSEETGLANKDSSAECGQVTTISRPEQVMKDRGVIGHVTAEAMTRIDRALAISIGLSVPNNSQRRTNLRAAAEP